MPQADMNHEQQAAIQAVRTASGVCRTVQQGLVTADTLQKKDRSPVTVADFASQAVVCAKLAQAFPDDPVVGEEDAKTLREDSQAAIRQAVVDHVAMGMGTLVDPDQVMDWIDRGAAEVGGTGSTPPRFWTLDPIDGTKGFLRGEQYAVALALIESGQVVLGVLGCPNLPLGDQTGALLVAVRGRGASVMPLWDADQPGRPVHVSQVIDPSAARFCESVESGHSSHGDAVNVAKRLGITADSVRMDSQAKYATVAQGQASIYLRLPTRAGYVEKIWDHAAGWIVVTEAGGRVTDIHGRPLDFTHGRTLDANQGIVATNGPIHDAVVAAIQEVVAPTA